MTPDVRGCGGARLAQIRHLRGTAPATLFKVSPICWSRVLRAVVVDCVARRSVGEVAVEAFVPFGSGFGRRAAVSGVSGHALAVGASRCAPGAVLAVTT